MPKITWRMRDKPNLLQFTHFPPQLLSPTVSERDKSLSTDTSHPPEVTSTTKGSIMIEPPLGKVLNSDDEDPKDGMVKQYGVFRGRRTRRATIVESSDEDDLSDTTNELTLSKSTCRDSRSRTWTSRDSAFKNPTSTESGRLRRSSRSTLRTSAEADHPGEVPVASKRRRLNKMHGSQHPRADPAGSIEGQAAKLLDMMPTPVPLSEQAMNKGASLSITNMQMSATTNQEQPVPGPEKLYFREQTMVLRDELEKYWMECEMFQQDAEQKAKRLSQVESEMVVKDEQLSELNVINTRLQEKIRELEVNTEGLRYEIKGIRNGEEALREELSRRDCVQDGVSKLAEQRAKEADSKLEVLQKKLSSEEHDNKRLQQSVDAARLGKAELQNKCVNMTEACSEVLKHWGQMAGDNLGLGGKALQKLKTLMQSE